MIIIDTCNTSSAIDIEGAETYFTNISLNDFPGENISDIVTHALRHIKVMCGAYDIYPKLGMTLLLKVWKTSSDIFNQSILNYYSDTDEVETKYYPKDPCLTENKNSYAKYVPAGVCGYLPDEYENIFKNIRWSALA